jgi:Phosphotransferase enzyme family
VTPELDTGFTMRCQRLCPGFRAIGTLPARKSEVIVGELYDGTAVIAKQLARPNDVWDWYLKREIAIYRAFTAKPPPFRVPRLYASSDDVLVIERIFGEPLARRRSPLAIVQDLDGLLALRDRIAMYEFPVTEEAPPAVRQQLRARFLEDPTDPQWIREGIARCAKRGLLPPAIGARVIAYLEEIVAASHGDLLLRNVVGGVLVDWECAGPHLVDWDLALLWTQLAPQQRPIVEEAARTESFLGIVAFALCREISFLHAYGKGPRHARLARITRELDDVCKRIE